jgi:glycosyltransferase involved in cell wall biosynthesis
MRIALVANTDWYLFGYRLDFAKALQRAGHQVTLVSPPGKYSPLFSSLGFDWSALVLSRKSYNLWEELASFLSLLKIYDKGDFALVHHFTVKLVIYGSIAGKLAKIPKVVNTITGLGFVFAGRSFLARALRPIVLTLYKLALGNTLVIFQNKEDKAFFEKKNLTAKAKTSLVPGSGVDLVKFPSTDEPAGMPPRVVLAARLIWEKGVSEFVQAADLLANKGVLCEFTLVGDVDLGNPSSIPQSEIEHWVNLGIVKWLGWQDNMPDIYSSSHIVCLPSYYAEGLPKSLIEAAACGRPVVAANVPGSREAVQDGLNGFLVPPKNAAALAEALERLILSPELRRKMGKAGRKLVEDHFSVDKINQQTLALYGEA